MHNTKLIESEYGNISQLNSTNKEICRTGPTEKEIEPRQESVFDIIDNILKTFDNDYGIDQSNEEVDPRNINEILL